LVLARADRLDRGFLHFLRSIEIGETLAQVDRAALLREQRELGKDGRREPRGAFGVVHAGSFA